MHTLTRAAVLAAAFSGIAVPALAATGNAHFIGSATGASLDGFSLVVSFKEAGLAAGSIVTISTTASLDATYQCVNGGTNVPSDRKKTTVSSSPESVGQFPVGQNGNLTGRLTLTAPAADTITSLKCGTGQVPTLTAVTWSHVSVTDETSVPSVTYAIRGTFSAGSAITR